MAATGGAAGGSSPSARTDHQSRIVRIARLVAAAVTGLWLAVVAMFLLYRPESLGHDWLILAHAARRFLDGSPIYLDPSGASFLPGGVDLYYGPPLLALLAVPLAPLPDAAIMVVAVIAGLGAVLVVIAALAPIAGIRARSLAFPLLVIGTELSFQVMVGAHLGATSILMLLLVGLAGVAVARERWAMAGLLVGLAGGLRVYPAVLALAFVAARHWRAAVATAVTGVVVLALGAILAGPDATAAWFGLLGEIATVSGASNVSAAGLAARAGLTGTIVGVVALSGYVVGGIVLLVGGWSLGARTPFGRALAWATACGGMLLMLPVAWDHYGSVLLPLLVLLAGLAPSAALLPAALVPAPVGVIAWWAIVPLGLAGLRRLRATSVRHGDQAPATVRNPVQWPS